MMDRYFGPVDALKHAVEMSVLMDAISKRPGALIERLSPEIRERLGELTSDQARNMRVWE